MDGSGTGPKKVAAIPKKLDGIHAGFQSWECHIEVNINLTLHEIVLVWNHNFKCLGTVCNFLVYLRSACLAVDVVAPCADHPAIKRAKVTITKKMLHTPRHTVHLAAACIWLVLYRVHA